MNGPNHPSLSMPHYAAAEPHATQLPGMLNVLEHELPEVKNRWRKLWYHPALMHYNRLVFVVACANLWLLAQALGPWQWWQASGARLPSLALAVAVNLTVAVLVRQQYVINGLFWLATRAPTHWPLALRWNLGKVYHFGGLHSGCACAATLWFTLFTGSVIWHLAMDIPGASAGVLAISLALLLLLCLLVVSAQPAVRRVYHNGFELTHRFGGWTALLLFWLQTVLLANDQRADTPLLTALLGSAGFWLLLLVSASVLLPWLCLKRVPIEVLAPSSHAAVITLGHAKAFPGSSTALSLSPLAEWHSFANIPQPGSDSYRIIVSKAGDWTGRFIQERPKHIWVKGIITAGVANIETLFTKVLYVATGSGIGPVLPHLIGRRVPTQLIWATRNPRKTYGDALVDEILQAQPDALIWDTDASGKPDLNALAYAAVRRYGVEAVIVISNQKLTEQVVWAMESRGIPGFGAIWDS